MRQRFLNFLGDSNSSTWEVLWHAASLLFLLPLCLFLLLLIIFVGLPIIGLWYVVLRLLYRHVVYLEGPQSFEEEIAWLKENIDRYAFIYKYDEVNESEDDFLTGYPGYTYSKGIIVRFMFARDSTHFKLRW